MGGWGEPKGPTAEERALSETIGLADRLAARVRSWESSPTMNNYWSMLDALAKYEANLI